MKSGYYIAILVVVFVVVGGALLYNSSTIYDAVPGEKTVVKKTTITKDEDAVVLKKEINILTDEDFEMDELDFVEVIDMSDFDDVNGFVDEEIIVF